LEAVGDARIVTLGDTGQLAAIGAGGWWADALDRHGSVELTVVRRQKDQADIDAANLIRDGKAREAFDDYDARGRFHTAPDSAQLVRHVFDDYTAHRDAGRTAGDVRIVVDGANTFVDTANRFAQADRLARGEIRDGGIEVRKDDEDRRWKLHEGDQVLMLQSVVVRGEDPIRNGSKGTVMKVDHERERVRVRFDDGREANLPATPAIGLNYAVHVAKFQGDQCAVVLATPSPGQGSRNAGYTQVTRGVDETHIYVDHERFGDEPKERLAEVWSEVDEKQTASMTIAQLRAAEEMEPLPPVHTDELMLEDIELDPLPELEDLPELPPALRPRSMSLERPDLPDRRGLEPPDLTRDLDRGLERDG
jgi:ATP-dependent exoDNAse (exonuclease V) alpha subunit